jgi:DNA invertase Pin-like site-specific DNA recombinase
VTSERRQDRLAKERCKRHGLVLEERTFADRGVSGWHGANRQSGALCALLKVVGPGDTILVEDTDRWSREPVLASLNALWDTVSRGVQIVFLKTGVCVNKSNFNDPTVLFPSFFGSYLANAENEKRSYRIWQAMEAKRHQIELGKIPFGRLPTWLAWNGPPHCPGRHPIIVEEKVQLVRRVYDLCLEGKGVGAIERLMRTLPPIA